jgi:hypothetical protein
MPIPLLLLASATSGSIAPALVHGALTMSAVVTRHADFSVEPLGPATASLGLSPGESFELEVTDGKLTTLRDGSINIVATAKGAPVVTIIF